MFEICLGIEPVRQPSPHRNAGGDCFACALTAAVRWMFPEKTIDFDAVWECFVEEYHDSKAQANLCRLRDAVAAVIANDVDGFLYSGSPAQRELERVYAEVSAEKPKTTCSNTWGEWGMEKAIKKAAVAFGGGWSSIEVAYELIQPTLEKRQWSHAWWMHEPVYEWGSALERYLAAGYVGMTSLLYDGGGPFDEKLLFRDTDHFVVIDGVRYGFEPQAHAPGSSSLNYYAHVVCSTGKGAYWIEIRDLMRKHGVAGVMFVRPDRTRT